MNFNVQGLTTDKLNSFEITLKNEHIDICCLSEHWQLNHIESVHIQNYHIVGSFCRKEYIRGGVCILARKGLNVTTVDVSKFCQEKTFEIACVKIVIDETQLFVCSLYRSPGAGMDTFFCRLLDLMHHIYDKRFSYIICGDFNINFLPKTRDSSSIALTNLFSGFGIRPTIFLPTRVTNTSESCIDNIFTDWECCDVAVVDNDLSDHTYQIAYLGVATNISSPPMKLVRPINQRSLQTFRDELMRVDLGLADGSGDVDAQFCTFFSIFDYLYSYSFPEKFIKNRNQTDKRLRFSRETIELSKLVKEMAAINKRIANQVYNNKYLALKKIYRARLREEKRSFNNGRLLASKNINKTSWDIINESRGKYSSTAAISIIDPFSTTGKILNDHRAISEAFNNFFVNLPMAPNKPDITKCSLKSSMRSFFLFPTTPSEIYTTINKICKKKSCGVDGISGTVIIAVADILAEPISSLINLSFDQGIYPDALKTSKVIPIYKGKGDHSDVRNFRPVALASQFSKIFEYCFNVRLSKYLEKYNIISRHQNGFRPGYSTQTALDMALSNVYEALNNKNEVAGLFFDMSRAFDTLDRDLLIRKLACAGVRGPAGSWVHSYLSRRSQVVDVCGSRSDSCEVAVGTPQGSCLSPTLFNVYINDLADSLREIGFPIIYADDCSVIITANSFQNLIGKCQLATSTMATWCQKNGLKLNTDKTYAIQFTTKNKSINCSPLIWTEGGSIQSVDGVRFLGITVDQKLTWGLHGDMINSKLSSYCYMIRNVKTTVSLGVLRLLYFGLVQSRLSYGLIYWGHSRAAGSVFILQKRIIRAMVGLRPMESCRNAFRTLRIMTLSCLYIYLLIIFIIEKNNNLQQKSSIHRHNTRTKSEFILPKCRLAISQTDPNYMGIKCLNKLQKITCLFDGFSVNRNFKNKLKDFLINRCYYTVAEFFDSDEL